MSRPVTLAAVVVSAALLSACGTGLEAQTYRESGRLDGANATLTTLAVRNLHVEAPASGSAHTAGGDAFVVGLIANPGDAADALVSASTDVAAAATLLVDGQPVQSVPVPAGGATPTTWSIALSGLTKELHAGTYISLTLSFGKAERTTVQVPVRAGDNGLSTREAAQNPYGEAE